MKVLIFGKENCNLCKNRLEFVKKIKDKFYKDIIIEYYDATTEDGLTELAFLGVEIEIPAVIIVNCDDNIIGKWIGAKEMPTTKSFIGKIKEIENGK